MSINKNGQFARQNNATKASIDRTKIYSTGSFKNVYKGVYIEGERKGQECVAKIFKSGSVFESSYFAVELKVVAKALQLINKFNNISDSSTGISSQQFSVINISLVCGNNWSIYFSTSNFTGLG